MSRFEKELAKARAELDAMEENRKRSKREVSVQLPSISGYSLGRTPIGAQPHSTTIQSSFKT